MRCHNRYGRSRKITALFTVLLGGLGLVGCKSRSPEARVDHMSEKIASKLDFDSNQTNLLKSIATEIKADIVSERTYRDSLKGEIKAMISAPEINKIRVKELLKARQERMEAKVDKYLDLVADLHRDLTPEQKQKLIEKLEQFSSRME